ncbi:MAG: hypothetical protein HMLKMBBP_01658 [Planctomycetes bacterium]|nr:hypothetical protein [Planctomycetota bacterium]
MADPNSLARTRLTLLATALSGCRRLLPIVATMNPTIAALILTFEAGATIAEDVNGDYVRNEVEALKRLVGRVEQRVMARCDLTEAQALDLLRRADVLKLLAEARDVYALAQYDSRLDRFASVVAGRALRADDDLEPDLWLAQAAIALTDAGVELLGVLVDHYVRGVYRKARPQRDGPPDPDSVVGETSLAELLRRVQPATAAVGAHQLDALRVLDAHGLAMHTQSLIAGINRAACADGTPLLHRTELWVATARGAEFISIVKGRSS